MNPREHRGFLIGCCPKYNFGDHIKRGFMPFADNLFLLELVEGPNHPYVANVFPLKDANISSTKKISEDTLSKPTKDTTMEEEVIALTRENMCMEGEDQSILCWGHHIESECIPQSDSFVPFCGRSKPKPLLE